MGWISEFLPSPEKHSLSVSCLSRFIFLKWHALTHFYLTWLDKTKVPGKISTAFDLHRLGLKGWADGALGCHNKRRINRLQQHFYRRTTDLASPQFQKQKRHNPATNHVLCQPKINSKQIPSLIWKSIKNTHHQSLSFGHQKRQGRQSTDCIQFLPLSARRANQAIKKPDQLPSQSRELTWTDVENVPFIYLFFSTDGPVDQA